MAVATLGDSAGGAGPATQLYPDNGGGDGSADGPLFVEVDNNGQHIRFRLANGEKYKTRPENWEDCIGDDGVYFLYTHKAGWQVWTNDLTGNAVTLGNKGKDKQRKGKHGGSSWKKRLA